MIIAAILRLMDLCSENQAAHLKEEALRRQDMARKVIGNELGVNPKSLTDDMRLDEYRYRIAMRMTSDIHIPINPEKIRTVGDIMDWVAEWDE